MRDGGPLSSSLVVRELAVLLKHWIVEDGELDVPESGDQVRAGLGIDVERVGLARSEARGVTPAPDTASPRGAARAVVTGTAVVIPGPDGRPAFDLVTVQPGLHAVLLGSGFPAGAESRTVTVCGLVVFEPYLWGDGGVLAYASDVGPVMGTVRAVRALSDGMQTPDQLVELDLVR